MAGGDYGAGAAVTGINNIATYFQRERFAKKEYKHFKRRYQIMRADLEAAGLNPMLAFGLPAGTPPAGVGQPGGGPLEGMGEAISRSVASAREFAERRKMNTKELEVRDAQIGDANAARDLKMVQQQEVASRRRQIELDNRIRETLLPYDLREAANRATQSDYERAFTEYLGTSPSALRLGMNVLQLLGGRGGVVAPRYRPGGQVPQAGRLRWRVREAYE